MACENECCERNRCLVESLQENVNSVVVVYTEGGCCFSGLLVSVCRECIKVITNSNRSGCCPVYSRSRDCDFGKVTVIPIDQITACTFCNTGL